MPLSSDDVLLVHLPVPAPEGWIEAAAKAFNGLRVRWHVAGWDYVKHSIETADSLPASETEGVTMLCLMPPPAADKFPGVRFVQLNTAGSDAWTGHALMENPEVIFCTGSGCHAPQIAERVIGAWLANEHNFSLYAANQRAAKWELRLDVPISDSQGRRMGIMGYGAIGRQVARLAQALGMEIYAYTRSPRPTPESRHHQGYTYPGTGDPEGVIPAKWFSGEPKDVINDFLAQGLDAVVVAMPLDKSTAKLFGKEQFDIMGSTPKKTFFINIARGGIVDQPTLVEALEKGTIRGAFLDVTEPEPLPSDDPLWKAPNLFITPHMAWQSTSLYTRVVDKLWKNVERLHKGEPLMDQLKK